MTRFLQWFNLLGIAALTVLCGLQWRGNRDINLKAAALERIRLLQADQLADRDRTIKAHVADLNDFRHRLSISDAALKEADRKLSSLTSERNRLVLERDQMVTQRDQLEVNLEQWTGAVAARDAALKSAGEQLQRIATERNDAIVKFNDLAGKYNAVVKDLNATRPR